MGSCSLPTHHGSPYRQALGHDNTLSSPYSVGASMVSNFSLYESTSQFGAILRGVRLLYRYRSYYRLSSHMRRRGVPSRDILRTQFPLIQSNPPAPAYITVEFTTYCNLKCVYCINQLALRSRGFMARDTFNRFV